MNMQKKVLSLCIALALGNNAFAAPEVEHKAKIEDKTCPAKGTVLTKEQKAKLPEKCLPAEEETTWEWIAGGAAAAVAGIVAIASGGGGGGGGDSSHHPDPVPDPTPDPDPIPDPDPVPDPAHETVSYANGALLDKTAKTLQIGGVTYGYALDGDRYALTAPDGSVLYTNSANWSVDANNDLLIKGKDAAGLYWSYDAAGKFIHADANTKVVEGDGTNTKIDTGTSASGQGSAGTIVDGDGTTTEISGGTSATDGGTGTKVDGNDAVVDNKGDTTASGDGSTGTDITGDGGKVINGGDSAITDGGTGTKIDGKDAQVDNKGDSTISGDGSTGTEIKGDDAVINNDGKTDVTDGGTGTKVDGDGADVINTGDTSASGDGSTVTDITGDGAAVDNTGKTDIADGGTGTKIDGKDAQVDNKGDSTISGDGSTGTDIKGDDAVINNDGKTDVTDGGTGTKVDGDGADVINTGDTSASGSGSTGTDITGDGAVVDNTGKTDVTDGGTGTKIDGKDAQVDNKGDSTISGEGSTGTEIKGDDATINNNGKTDVTEGGTGTKIDGNGADVINTGDTSASGSGSTGTVITGDGAVIDNTGKTDVTDGGTGTKVDGNDAKIDNKGDTTATGTGSAGTVITGDNAQVNNQGDTTVADGATGTKIDGNNAAVTIKGDGTEPAKIDVTGGGKGVVINGNDAKIAIEDATANVDGTGSALATITGDNATATIAGDIYVKNAAHGVDVAGDNSTVTTTANLFVQDLNSVGINISALNDGADEKTTFKNTGDINVTNNATGAIIGGDKADVALGGNVNVTAVADGTGVLQLGTGVIINGDNSAITLNGNVNVKADAETASITSGNLDGVDVNGSHNAVVITGAVNVESIGTISNVDGAETIGYDGFTGEGTYLYGLNVTGSDNLVTVEGGVTVMKTKLEGSDGTSAVVGLGVDGNNTVNVSGHSSVTNNSNWLEDSVFAHSANGGQILLTKDSTLDVAYTGADGGAQIGSILSASGSGSAIENAGTINATLRGGILMQADRGATVKNSGTVHYGTNGTKGAALSATGNASAAINIGTLDLKNYGLPSYNGGAGMYPLMWVNNTAYGELATGTGSRVENDGSITLQGPGLFGMGAAKNNTQAINTGSIYLDGFGPTQDSSGNPVDKAVYTRVDGTAYYRGAGMVAGSTDSGVSANAQATNTGDITVNNSGFGMLALNGGTVTNQGNITLTADATTVSDGNQAQLVGMGAMLGGTAINDTTGKITINTDVGKAFYVDSNASSRIINKGQIIVGSGVNPAVDNSASTVKPTYADGSTIAAEGATTTLDSLGAATASGTSTVNNAGIVKGGSFSVDNLGTLVNQLTGDLQSAVVVNSGGTLNNSGTVTGALTANTGSTVNNSGTVASQIQVAGGTVTNAAGGVMHKGMRVTNATSKVENHGTIIADGGQDIWMSAGTFINRADGTFSETGGRNSQNDGGSIVSNQGTIISDGSQGSRSALIVGTGDKNYIINSGTISQMAGTSNLINTAGDAATGSMFWNQSAGTVDFKAGAAGKAAITMQHTNTTAVNDGTVNISGNGAVGMTASKNAKVVNNGTLNLGTVGTADTGMIGMQLDANATADAVIENNGIINVNASDSYAFSKLGANGHVVNTGTVNFAAGVTGSALVKQEGITPETTKVATYTLPTDPATASQQVLRNTVSHYTVGTTASGNAGQMVVDHADLTDVQVDTGFTAGTAAKSQTFDNVFQGTDIQGAENIQADSVVWSAEGKTDASGNVDVTMTKKAYTDVVTDAGVNSVAGALEAGYTNNALYQSLNLKTAKDVTNAMKQLSGSKATSAFNDAKVLSNRFTMLADSAIETSSGLGFNVVAKGDKRAELGNNTQYDMMALSQKLSLTDSQTLKLQYGIARLDGNGDVKSAGDNGLTGGYSQFFGLEHHMDLGDEMSWNNALRYDNHQLDSSRSIQYGSVNEVADSKNTQQYMELKSQFSKGFALSDTLNFKPSVGAKVRHTRDGSVNETGANDYNLKMDAGSETAVDAIAGMELTYAGKNGWAATASVEGGPNLSYSKSARSASLQGAAGQRFSVDDGQKGGGVNSLSQVGVSYSQGNTSLAMDAYNWKEDGASDKGLNLNLKVKF